MAAKKPNRKPKVLTLGDVAPLVTYHQPGEIPLANATDRFALLDWEDILKAIVGKRIVAVSCEPSEVDTVLRHIYQHYHDQDEGEQDEEDRVAATTGGPTHHPGEHRANPPHRASRIVYPRLRSSRLARRRASASRKRRRSSSVSSTSGGTGTGRRSSSSATKVR